ncbi:MAG TPA: hypothetical protein VJS11_14905 [Acidobacteriaceae bacterium]|nr:hypothetical protein [Acidobacteriaceae bacterium]
MSDDPGNPSSFLGTPGEPVAEVDPDDLKTFWHKSRKLQASHPDVSIGFDARSIAEPPADAAAIWLRSGMIWALTRYAPEQLATWITDEEISDAVFRTMATIPMEWIGPTDREGLPFDVEEFFRRLREDVPNG